MSSCWMDGRRLGQGAGSGTEDVGRLSHSVTIFDLLWMRLAEGGGARLQVSNAEVVQDRVSSGARRKLVCGVECLEDRSCAALGCPALAHRLLARHFHFYG